MPKFYHTLTIGTYEISFTGSWDIENFDDLDVILHRLPQTLNNQIIMIGMGYDQNNRVISFHLNDKNEISYSEMAAQIVINYQKLEKLQIFS